MKQETKLRILSVGAEIIHRKGFNHTGIQEILLAAGVPKGSFYNYFKNKEDFGLQVIDYFVEYFEGLAKGVLEDPSSPPLRRVYILLGHFIEFFKTKDFELGCPIGNLSQEMGDLSPVFREKLRFATHAMISRYTKVLEEARISGEIPNDLDIPNAAAFIVSSWHGALVQMKIMKNAAPLENHRRFIFDKVLRF